jgi:hypothetical protein
MTADHPHHDSAPQEEPKRLTSARGDLINREWGESPSWFGYIGVGIALASMLLGIAGIVLAVRYFIGWFGS